MQITRSMILECFSFAIGIYWNSSGVPVLPEQKMWCLHSLESTRVI